MSGPDAPGYGDPIEEVLAWHAENRVAVAIAVGQEALNLPLLLGFVTGLHGLVGRRGGAGADWSRLAVAAGATLSAVLALYAVLWIGVVLSAGELAEPSPVFELVWQLHAAAFALALPALGTTFIGAALAAHASGLTPPWQRLLGVAGGGLLLAAGAASLAIADGSALLFVGLPGFAAWLVWHPGAVAIAVGLVALYLPLLLVFVTGLHGLVERRGGAGADWSRLALAAGATLSAIFVLVNVLQIGLALSAGGLAEPTPGVRARLAGSRGGVRAGAADARHHLHRRGPRRARERADSGLAAPAGPGGREPAARRGARQPRDRRRLGADLRRAPRVRRLARLAARDRRAPRP